MKINKFQGKTKEEAIGMARQEMGADVVIMNTKEIKPKGIFKVFKNTIYEVTAAVEDRNPFQNAAAPQTAQQPARQMSRLNLVVDEKLNPQDPALEELVSPRQIRPASQPLQKPAGPQAVSQMTPLSDPQPLQQQKTQQEPARRTVARQADALREQVSAEDKRLDEQLERLSDVVEKELAKKIPEPDQQKAPTSEEMNFIRIIYTTLLNNEVNEKYANQILDEVERYMRPGNSLDLLLPNVYQKLILRFGQPHTIDLSGKTPKVVFFVGPTGVGKTTTIAKISSKYKVEMNKKVAFLTADTYRIAATEQLKVYANILEAPLSIIYTAEDLNKEIEKIKDYDLIFVDTAGFSHKNHDQKEDIKKLIQGTDPQYNKEVYLVLSATTKYKDLLEIVDIYHEIFEHYKLIFTKLDETTAYGNLLNIKLYSGAELSYVTNGQNVPDDMEVFDTQKIVKQLLGGK